MSTLHDESVAFWTQNQVAHLPVPITEAESWRALERRNGLYPGFAELMPADYPGNVILDYGCGPGHDTIRFLADGARFVYACDVSPYALQMVNARLEAHGWRGRCLPVLITGDWEWDNELVDVAFVNGVLHHCADPAGTLERVGSAVAPYGVIHLMVYSAESWLFRVRCGGDPAVFEELVDGGAPIAKAWTRQEVIDIAAAAGFEAEWKGSYLMQEPEGPGLGGCWELRR